MSRSGGQKPDAKPRRPNAEPRRREAELRRRLELVADAEHELRAPVTVLALLAARMRRDAGSRAYGEALDAQLARLRAGLEDLAAARHGRTAAPRPAPRELRPLAEGTLEGWGGGRLDWSAGAARVVADPGRLAQALGNLVANAREHGDGEVAVRGRVAGAAVRIEVRNRPRAAPTGAPAPGEPARAGAGPRPGGRGRGLRIARRAAAAAGGRLELSEDGDQVVAALEVPLAERPLPDAA